MQLLFTVLCDGGTEFDMKDGDKTTVGTEITLFLNEDCLEFANEYRAREVIEKYCSFMPTEIYLSKANAPEEYETIDKEDVKDTDKVIEEIHEEAKTEEKENDKGEKEIVEVSPAKDKVKIVKRPVPLNDTNPLWTKIQVNVPMRITRNFTARYLWITRSLCSGSI